MRSFSVFCAVVASLAASASGDHHEGHHGTKVGELKNYNHGIAGTVYAVDESTIFIKVGER